MRGVRGEGGVRDERGTRWLERSERGDLKKKKLYINKY